MWLEMSENKWSEFELPEDIYMGLKLYKIEKYKTPKEKIKEMLRVRMGFQIRNPMSDPMTSKIIKTVEDNRQHLVGKILDVGCYTGALYHWLGKPPGYVGLDKWQEAIDVAKEFAPEATFICSDVMDIDGSYDVVWCSQLLFPKGAKEIDKINSLGKMVIII